jgi:hypothetical protein
LPEINCVQKSVTSASSAVRFCGVRPSRIASTVSCGTPASIAQFTHALHSYGASSAREPISAMNPRTRNDTIDSSAWPRA